MKKVKNRKLYLSFILLSHGIMFATILKGTIFNTLGIILFIVGGIYFVQGIRDRKERK